MTDRKRKENTFENLVIVDEGSGGPTIRLIFKGVFRANNLPEVEEYFETLDFTKASEIILELKELSFMESPGLGFFIRLKRIIDEKGGQMQIINPNPNIRKIFRLTRLDQGLIIVDHPD